VALVKVRWKTIDATDNTPAKEFNTILAADEVAESLATADQDLPWAAAVAAFAEHLKKSPYADAGTLTTTSDIVTSQAGRDADRQEFAALFARAASMLPPF
jgi:hypothetical protein